MARLTGTVFGLLVLCVALPVIARAAAHLTPYLVGLLVLLGIGRLFWPERRSRRR